MPLASPISQWRPVLVANIVPELNCDVGTVHEALVQYDGTRGDEIRVTLDAMDAARHRVAKAHRRLQWSELESQIWITGAFRERVREALFNGGQGNTRAFLACFREIKGMRDDNKASCEQWLKDEGYLADLPSLNDLTEVAYGRLPDDFPHRRLVAQGIATFFAAYATR